MKESELKEKFKLHIKDKKFKILSGPPNSSPDLIIEN